MVWQNWKKISCSETGKYTLDRTVRFGGLHRYFKCSVTHNFGVPFTKRITYQEGSDCAVSCRSWEKKKTGCSAIFVDQLVKIDFIVIRNVLVELLISQPILFRLRGALAFNSKDVCFDDCGKQYLLQTFSDYSCL